VSFGEPAAGPPRVIAVLVVAAVFAGIALGIWLFGLMT
jgi:hypothetical protein